jgi:hypothetical protein
MWLTLDRHIIYGLLNHSGTNSRCSLICSIFAFFITHYNKFVQSMQNCQNNTPSYINRLFVKCIELLQHPPVYYLTLVQICGVEDQWDSIRSATCALLRRRNFFKQFQLLAISPTLIDAIFQNPTKKIKCKKWEGWEGFLLRLNGLFTLNQFLIYDGEFSPLSHNLNLASICWLFHLANGCFNFDTSLSSYNGVTKETSVILCFFRQIGEFTWYGPFWVKPIIFFSDLSNLDL